MHIRTKCLIATSGLFLLASAACGPRAAVIEAAGQSAPVSVHAIRMAPTQIPEVVIASGTVSAKTTTVLSSRILAQVVSVSVREGDRIRAGQTLVLMNGEDLDSRYASANAAREEVNHSIDAAALDVTAAKANLELAEVTQRRLKELYEKKSISDQEFDEANTKLKTAQAAYEASGARREQLSSRASEMTANVRTAQISRSYSRITAPFSGVVISRNVEPGIMAAPGVALMTIECEGQQRLEVSLAESHLGQVRIGERVAIQLDALNQSADGTVSEIVPLADAHSRSYTVKVDLPGINGLHAGMFGRAMFPIGKQTALTVPSDAVTERGQLQSVIVADSGLARMRLITTGLVRGAQVVVLSGLQPGDSVIYPVPRELKDGMTVEVRP